MPEGHVVLVGLMGAGKSTVGRRVAEALGRPLLDVDALVEARCGTTIAQVFEDEGEEGFRDHESAAVAEVCAWPVPAVIATGGGAVLRPENRARLRDAGTVVWLSATPTTLADRVRSEASRPLLEHQQEPPEVVLQRLLDERRPFYEELADEVVVVDDLTREQVAECVIAAVGQRAAAS